MEFNHFDQCIELLEFPENPQKHEEVMYLIEIIKRRKDKGNEYLSRGDKHVDEFYIYSKNDMIKYKQIIIDLCIAHNARAYIHPRRRNLKQVSSEAMQIIAMYFGKDQFRPIRGAYIKACKRHPDPKHKRWLLDVDTTDKDERMKIFEDMKDNYIALLPTPNGCHYITEPFDSRKLLEKYPDISVQRNNPTLLYFKLKN